MFDQSILPLSSFKIRGSLFVLIWLQLFHVLGSTKKILYFNNCYFTKHDNKHFSLSVKTLFSISYVNIAQC
jgi:hypothetical protein